MTGAFQKWANELNGSKHQAAVEFFKRSVDLSAQLLDFFGKLIKLLFSLSQNSAFSTFLKDLETTALPALTLVAHAYSLLFKGIALAAGAPGISQIIEVFAALV